MVFLIAVLVGLLAFMVSYNLLYRGHLRMSQAEKNVAASFEPQTVLL